MCSLLKKKNAASSLELLGRSVIPPLTPEKKNETWHSLFKRAEVEQVSQILHILSGHHCCKHKQFIPEPVWKNRLLE